MNGAGLSDSSKELLEVLRRAGDKGLITEDFAQAIGVDGLRSIPVRMMALGNQLKMLGLKSKDVVQRDRVYVKSKARSMFKAGPKLDEAFRRSGSV